MEISPFWMGSICTIAALFVILTLIFWLANQKKAFVQYYQGLKVSRWVAMGLVVLGFKMLTTRKGPVKLMRAQGRVWLSPDVKIFVDDKAVQD